MLTLWNSQVIKVAVALAEPLGLPLRRPGKQRKLRTIGREEVSSFSLGTAKRAAQISKELVLPKLLINLVSSLMNFRKAVGLMQLNFSKAFDKMLHNILISKLVKCRQLVHWLSPAIKRFSLR